MSKDQIELNGIEYNWPKILIVVVLAIIIIGPKDFPIVLKKIGNWIGSTKRYFSEVQQKVNETVDEVSIEDKYSKKSEKKVQFLRGSGVKKFFLKC